MPMPVLGIGIYDYDYYLIYRPLALAFFSHRLPKFPSHSGINDHHFCECLGRPLVIVHGKRSMI